MKKQQLAKRRKKGDQGLLEESLQVSKRLQKYGVVTRKEYSLRSPFEKRLFRASIAELAHSES